MIDLLQWAAFPDLQESQLAVRIHDNSSVDALSRVQPGSHNSAFEIREN
jgi:hypothetical protein